MISAACARCQAGTVASLISCPRGFHKRRRRKSWMRPTLTGTEHSGHRGGNGVKKNEDNSELSPPRLVLTHPSPHLSSSGTGTITRGPSSLLFQYTAWATTEEGRDREERWAHHWSRHWPVTWIPRHQEGSRACPLTLKAPTAKANADFPLYQ